ncbi:GMC oxidoreductase [Klebsiella oxytoca]|uniref:GMC oxidoreductase n=1 Tax=Klebsiella oxytoca TaxID=571 RepID=UPI0035709BD8
MTKKTYDAIVIGSGATGGFAVKELTERGLQVLLLEAGPIHSNKDFEKIDNNTDMKGMNITSRIRAFLRGQYIQALAASFSEAYSFLYTNDRKNPYSHPLGRFYLWIRGRHLGGRFLNWGRVLMRMSDYDFKAADKDGHGENWPICYDDLVPYYDHVESFLGVVGQENSIPNLPDGKYISKARLTTAEQQFKKKTEARWSNRRIIPWRYMSAHAIKNHTPTTILAAQSTGRLNIKANAIAKRILIDEQSGLATGVIYVDGVTKREETVSANIIFVCASTIESVRLLLNSACPTHPSGLGNSSGTLGHYFMDQTVSIIAGTVPGTTGWEQGDQGFGDTTLSNPGGIYIPRFQNLDKITHPEFARGFNIQGEIGRRKNSKDAPATYGFMAQGEMLPRFENSITINRRRTDAWGIPVPHITCTTTDNDHKMLQAQLKALKEMVVENGLQIDFAANVLGLDDPAHLLPNENFVTRLLFRLSYKKSLAIGAAIHECGGARMGNDPKKSVLNSNNQMWDVKNIFVTDSSCFVTSGSCGPTLTTMALTVRACEFAVREFGK